MIDLGYDSRDRNDKMENRDEIEYQGKSNVTISLEEPLTFWIGILVIAALMQLVAIPLATARGQTGLNNYMNEFANYAIYIPGLIILPLLVAVWIGERVSYIRKKKSEVAYKGVMNAIYASLVYVIAIFIIYLIMTEQKLGVLATIGMPTFVEYFIVVPLVINIVVVPLFAVLSAERRYG